jgi:pseudaminic acid synthase
MRSPFIVAELAASHCGSLARALELVEAAHLAGADAVKLQTWSEMTVADHVIEAGPWAGRQLRDLYDECRTPWEWHRPIFERCRALGIVGFSTPFDAESVAFLEALGVLVYKVASFEITDLPLIRRIAETDKPIILSTGMATLEEIGDAVAAARSRLSRGITLLHCVSSYPASPDAFRLGTMAHMAARFKCDAGLSDHSQGSAVATAAAALGATVIEKHITLDRAGPDGGFAATVEEFGEMVMQVRDAAAALGAPVYGPHLGEMPSLALRRGLWVIRDIAEGEQLTAENVASRRPAAPLAPAALDRVLGSTARTCLARGTALELHHLR